MTEINKELALMNNISYATETTRSLIAMARYTKYASYAMNGTNCGQTDRLKR